MKAGIIVGGYITFAPKKESSIASVYDNSGKENAFFTILGSAVIIPFTSVQISISLALRADPNIAAV